MSISQKLTDLLKNRLNFVSMLISVCILFFTFVLLFLGSSKKIVGVQLLTSRGTVLVGTGKYSGDIHVWVSPQIGWFKKDGTANFFEIKHKKDKISQKNWEILWEWDELYQLNSKEKEPLIRFMPSSEEKDAAVETLSSLCQERKDISLSCQWSINKRIFIEALTENYMCLSDMSGEFYGGAHPIALRRFGTYDLKNKKFAKFSEFIADGSVKEEIWSQLYDNIKNILEQSILAEENGNASMGGVDIFGKSPESESASNISTSSFEERLAALLNSQGYTFSPNVFCPIVRPEGPFLLFGFPHSEQVNRGLNFKAEALLNQENLPKQVTNLFKDYKFTKPNNEVNTALLSPSDNWKLSQNLKEIKIYNKKKFIKLILPESEESSEEMLGLFWIYKSPTLKTLKQNNFKKVKISKNIGSLDLNKVF